MNYVYLSYWIFFAFGLFGSIYMLNKIKIEKIFKKPTTSDVFMTTIVIGIIIGHLLGEFVIRLLSFF